MSGYSHLDGSQIVEFGATLKDFSKHTKALRELASNLGTIRDTAALREKLNKERDAGRKLSKQLFDMANAHPTGRVERQQHDKLCADFRSVLEEYERVTKLTLDKEREIHTAIRESMMGEDLERAAGSKSPTELRKSQRLTFQELGAYDETALKEREEEIKELESDLRQANTLFRDVSELVGEQGIMLDQIEGHADVAVEETGKAVVQLDRAEVYQKRARSKIVWIIICVLILIGIVIAIVLVVKVGLK